MTEYGPVTQHEYDLIHEERWRGFRPTSLHARHSEWLLIARAYCDKHGLDKRTHVRGLMQLLASEWAA